MAEARRWDIFCTVIDNYGDIGICWRLARQLVAEHGLALTLWVDDLASFRRLWPAVDPSRDEQVLEGVRVRRWGSPFPEVVPAQVVIEALACELPASYVQAMAATPVKPVWLNLEYLSAEDWVLGCHGLPSLHPSLPLTKHFFFPGFVAGTGGLLAEHNLPARLAAFQADPAAQAEFLKSLGMPVAAPEALQVSLFAYEASPLAGLLDAWADGPRPVVCRVPESKLWPELLAWLAEPGAGAGQAYARGRLRIELLPMLAQDDYDRLLWLSDLNVVRGEDSFVRAQWAGKPLIWQAYRQEDGVHLDKLEAFLALYTRGASDAQAEALRELMRTWNGGGDMALAWRVFEPALPRWREHAQTWAEQLARTGDLATNLVQFCSVRV
ncbi:MAG: elongation factor P maturation arginine rhamnosyltransferase EarP [Gammaproteobacteria bacterium]|nr:elongation factor P maturation arginine rhamnosyltransferase EarP [Gammaproteobacteria bacterium]